MNQPENSTGPSPSSPSSPWAAPERPDTDATAPLWFGDRASGPAAGSSPAPQSWSASAPASTLPAAPPSPPQRPRRTWPGLVAVSLLSASLASGGTYAAVRAADEPAATPAASSAAQQSSGSATSAAQEIDLFDGGDIGDDGVRPLGQRPGHHLRRDIGRRGHHDEIDRISRAKASPAEVRRERFIGR